VREIILDGVVVTGDRRGRELGFPTANIELSEDSPELPGDGIYAGWLEVTSATAGRLPAAISIGSRPTYYGEHGVRLVEVYVLDFSGDLYGEHVRVGVSRKIRGQIAYEGDEALIEQMHRDVAAIREGGSP
jgi:riboflavin kinase/FMN adenylyltransferase